MKELRHYQVAGIDGVSAAFRAGHRRVILCISTGGGKSACGMEMIRRALDNNKRAVFITDRNLLIDQFYEEALSWGLDPGLIRRGGFTDRTKPFQIVSKGTLYSKVERQSLFAPPHADLVVVDECHRSVAAQFSKVMGYWPKAYFAGLTATPVLPDGRGMGGSWHHLVCPVMPSQLLDEGFLVPARCFAPTFPDLTRCRTGEDGDFKKEDIEKVMSRANMIGDAVGWWKRLAEDKQTLVYGVSRQHSRALRDSYLKAGVKAVHVDGETEDEQLEQAVADFKAKRIRVLTCADLLTEGADLPVAEVIQVVRPTRSLRLYLQMIGRGMRPYTSKQNFVVIDHAGVVLLHGLPGMDIEWRLDPNEERIEARKAKDREEGREATPVCCPKCFTMFAGRPDCPTCGHKAKGKSVPVVTRQGTLVRVGEGKKERRVAGIADWPKVWRQCLAIAFHKGRTWGTAASIFKAKTNRMPIEAGVEPLPSDGVWKKPVGDGPDCPEFLKRKRAHA